MANPFVPVDLDKLLDEFEEKEETKPEQLATAGAIHTTNRQQLTKQSFQSPFPSIEEEVLSDQASDRHNSYDGSESSSGSDSDSIAGVIIEAEAITNQRLLLHQPQATPGTVEKNVNNELKEDVVIKDHTPSDTLNVNDASDCIEESDSGGFALGEQKCVNQHEFLSEESEAVKAPAGFAASEPPDTTPNNNDVFLTDIRNTCDMLAPTAELLDEHTTSGAANQEEHQTVGEKNTVEPGIILTGQNHGLTKVVDTTVRHSEPEISNVAMATDSEARFSEFGQVPDGQGSLGEPSGHVSGLLGKRARNSPGSSNFDFQDMHTSEPSTVAKADQGDPVMSTDSTSEAASEATPMPAQTVLVSDISHSEDYNHSSNVSTNLQSTILNEEPPQTVQLNEPGASSVSMATDSMTHLTEVYNESSDLAAQAVLDDQAGTSNLTQSNTIQGEPSGEYDQGYDGIPASGPEAGMLPLSNEMGEYLQPPSQQIAEPDLTIAMQYQGSLEARRITAGEANLGNVPPIWVPDSVATHCMNCGVKFGVIKRRHHCRACGKALCSSCCNMKFLLPYLDNKEGRVCQVCCNALLRAQALRQVAENQTTENLRTDDENATEDLMLDVGLEEDDEDVLPVDEEEEVLQASEAAGDDDSADFAGAGVDATPEQSVPVLPPLQLPIVPPPDLAGTPLSTPTSPALSDDSDCLFRLDVDNVRSLLPQDITALPPVLKVVNEEVSVQERPDPAEIMYQLKGLHETVLFLLNKNLVIKVSIVKLSCCVKRKCWCFVTEGMGAANQEEMVVLLECLRKETMLPKDVLSHFNTAFAYAKQGHTVSELGYTIFGQPFLGSNDNAGFLYIKPTYQCLKNLPLPSTPYVVGILIKRPETPWAQLFPLRLQLRLGAEYRYYPCPLFSSRNRSAVYGEVGHTIMNLLADFKNFQYTLARVTGLVIHMEEKKTLVRLPQDRYDEVLKILNAADEHVMALGAHFSLQADSHLVCIQSEQGYKTQAINIQNQPRKVTGASFIVFSGALKTSSPFMAKISIVEDGIMVQLLPEAIAKLRNSLKEMKDYTITTGIPGGEGEEQVIIEWVSPKDVPHQSSLTSPIDGLQLEGFPSVKVHTGCDFTRKSVFRIQWTEMFFLGDGQQSVSRDINKLTAELAQTFCRTLMPHLSKLNSENFTCIGLRVSLDSENVGYFTGSNQQSLPTSIMSELDDVLVPVIHNAASRHRRRSVSVELLFKILRLL